jgi:hypothetical protein
MGTEDMAQPEVKGEITMRRHQSRVMVGGFGIDVVAPRRLDGDGGVAMEHYRQMENAIGEEWIARGLAPARRDLRADRFGQAGKVPQIFVNRQPRVISPG